MSELGHRRSRTPVVLVLDAGFEWAPLALGLIQAYAEAQPLLAESYAFLPWSGPPGQVPAFSRVIGRGVWLFSNYAWNAERNREVSQALARVSPGSVRVHGGPHVPKRPEALREHLANRPDVDVAVRGEGELTVAEVLGRLLDLWSEERSLAACLQGVAGVSFRAGAEVVRGPERPRIEDLDTLPSPLLGGHLDRLADRLKSVVIETNRGCPYGCTFCDWGSLTQQKIKRFDLERVKQEIEWCGRHRIERLFFADANFGIFERDLEIAAHCGEVFQRWGYPKAVDANFAKNCPERIAEIVKLWRGFSTEGVVALQTLDPRTLEAVQRSNIKVPKLLQLAETFRNEGLPIAAELILGLPGATVESFCGDLQRLIDLDIPARIYETELLPNSPMADPEYRREFQIVVDDANRVVQTAAFTREDYRLMRRIARTYFVCEVLGVLRYVLRYLQWDHGIPAAEVVRHLAEHERAGSELSWLSAPLAERRSELSRLFSEGSRGWERFYQAVATRLADRFLEPGPGLELALRLNAHVMPSLGRELPADLPLEHDFERYVEANKRAPAGETIPLLEYGPGSLTVADPEGRCARPYEALREHVPIRSPTSWELESNLRRQVVRS